MIKEWAHKLNKPGHVARGPWLSAIVIISWPDPSATFLKCYWYFSSRDHASLSKSHWMGLLQKVSTRDKFLLFPGFSVFQTHPFLICLSTSQFSHLTPCLSVEAIEIVCPSTTGYTHSLLSEEPMFPLPLAAGIYVRGTGKAQEQKKRTVRRVILEEREGHTMAGRNTTQGQWQRANGGRALDSTHSVIPHKHECS